MTNTFFTPGRHKTVATRVSRCLTNVRDRKMACHLWRQTGSTDVKNNKLGTSGKCPLQLWATFATLQSCKVAKVSSTLPSPGYSMWNPWNGGWIPWNGGWIPWNGGWIPLGNSTGWGNPHGLQVRVTYGTGTGQDSPTRELSNEPKNVIFGQKLREL